MEDSTKEQILKGASLKYDELYERASEVVRKVNPCRIKDGKCRAGAKVEDGLCCHGCKHLGPNGCTVQSLGCKMWLCYFGGSVRRNLQVGNNKRIVSRYFKLMNPIIEEASEFGITDGRATKDELIKRWYEQTMDRIDDYGVLLAQAHQRFIVALKSNKEVRCKWHRSSW